MSATETDWTEDGGGWRRWPKGRGAVWRITPGGGIEARDVRGLPVVVAPRDVSGVQWLAPGLRAAGATPRELRALLAIADVESGGWALPMFGDYRTRDGQIVRPGTPGALPPRSVGFYQFTRPTLEALGYSWNELARSESANHRAALSLLRRLEPRHRGDFMTLAALWNAGSIRPSVANDVWGIVSFRPDTLTKYAGAWSAVGRVTRPHRAQRSLGPAIVLGAGLAWAFSRAMGGARA
jgi:hypothetical protein